MRDELSVYFDKYISIQEEVLSQQKKTLTMNFVPSDTHKTEFLLVFAFATAITAWISGEDQVFEAHLCLADRARSQDFELHDGRFASRVQNSDSSYSSRLVT